MNPSRWRSTASAIAALVALGALPALIPSSSQAHAVAKADSSLPGEQRESTQVVYTFPASGVQVKVDWQPQTPQRTVIDSAQGRVNDTLVVLGDTDVRATFELIDEGRIGADPSAAVLLGGSQSDLFPGFEDSQPRLEPGVPVSAVLRANSSPDGRFSLGVFVEFHDGASNVFESYRAFEGEIVRRFADTTISATFPRSSTAATPVAVRNGANLGTVTGRVLVNGAPPSPSRLVRLAVRSRGPAGTATWVPLTGQGLAFVTDSAGNYSLQLPTYWTGRRELRVLVPGADQASPAMSGPFFVDVKRTVPTFGKRSASAILGHRLDPCEGTEIKWVARWDGAPPNARRDMTVALARLSEASGYTFTYVGTTDRIPFLVGSEGIAADNQPLPQQARLLVSWAKEKEAPQLAGRESGLGVVGLGGMLGSGRVAGNFAIAEQVAALFEVEYGTAAAPGGGKGQSLIELYLHELGHALGLAHTLGSGQAMDQGISLERDVFGRGDRRGLERVGVASGCASAERAAGRGVVYIPPVP